MMNSMTRQIALAGLRLKPLILSEDKYSRLRQAQEAWKHQDFVHACSCLGSLYKRTLRTRVV
jgi:hypothetical protein